MFSTVALKTTFNDSILTYKNNGLELVAGQSVQVPLRNRMVEAIVIDPHATEPDTKFEIKPISQLSKNSFDFAPRELELIKWVSDYYHYPLGLLIFDIQPKFLKRPRKLDLLIGQNKPFEFQLNNDQNEIVQNISPHLNSFNQFLIHGITGSGKTAIYIRIIQQVLKNKKSVLFLLPEINLTPQFLETLEQYLDCPIYSYHSAISNSDKFALWTVAQKSENTDEPFVILGVRSSVFVPVSNLGLIITDEEHDPSFKQEERCPYNARDIAIKKAHLFNIPIILGSATPSFESYQRLKDKPHSYFSMNKRVGSSTLPTISLVSNADQDFTMGELNIWPFTQETINKIKIPLEKNEQVLIFVNRLGHANYLMCKSCGHQFLCPNCSTSLRYFKARNELSCNICDYKQPPDDMCPICSNMTLSPKGFGTEFIQTKLQEIFPNKSTKRLDRDEIKTMTALKDRLKEFHTQEIDILVGTQMVSKGHNFRNVNLVVILSIDAQLNYPDYKANERVFQLLKQVSGRSGRYSDQSEVVIQTYSAHHPIFSYVKEDETEKFYQEELDMRKQSNTPPFLRVIVFYVNSYQQQLVIEESEHVMNMIQSLIKQHFPDVQAFGPRPAMVEKKRNEFTWTIMVKSADTKQLHQLASTLKKNIKLHTRSSLRIDVDPYCIY